MTSTDAIVARTRYYQSTSKGPWVVFFRPKGKSLRTLDISRDLLRQFSGVSIHKERPDKLRVEALTFDVANKIVDHEAFNREYHIYIPSREVEIEGVVTDASLSVDELKKASGSFKNSMIGDLVKILDVRNLHSASLEENKKVYKPSHSFRITFAGSVLPNNVKVENIFFPVRLFVPRVYNCTNCKKLGHSFSHCGNKFRCGKCGEKHSEDSCTQTVEKCIHCGENPHPLQECPRYKQHSDKVKRSIAGRSKRTYAEMLKTASAAQDENQFSVLSSQESDSDSDEGHITAAPESSIKDESSKRKLSSPTVHRKKPKVTLGRLSNSKGNSNKKTNPKAPSQPVPGCSKDFTSLPREERNKNAAPRTSRRKFASNRGLIGFSDIVDFILNTLKIQDPLRSFISALLPSLKSYLKQLTASWPLLASIISFDG
ncbi:uncharacterized protein LOC129775454 [Toxorhynchites rutilus septentrionalis]|uniref:uncharacterized protein LOC129775454 n=1 Tax=Toxorhynchites rutilus septentrionalis TaxID=329112 RepID=UPI00247A69E6|nr:uncharacterized protein LOC129775454 [Toxorhynchites rutilus septentrionalis]